MRALSRRSAAAGSQIFFGAMLALLPVATTALACSTFDSCGACRNTSACHWCPDQLCHVLGSIHGCFYGTSCYDNNQCLRQVPEFRGYSAPSIGVLLGVFLVGSTALVCGLAAISVAREYAKESAATREGAAVAAAARTPTEPAAAPRSRPEPASGETEYMTLVGNEGGLQMSDDPDPTAEEEGEAAAIKGKRRIGRAGRVGGAYRSGFGGRAASGGVGRGGGRRGGPGPSPLARKILLFTRVVCGTGMVAAVVMCGVVVWFAPHAPGVNMCNTEFDWKSIVQSLAKASLETDFQLLVSIYNPNVLDAKIESGTAILYHKHTEVGLMAFEPAVLEGGYVTDLLLTIAFDGEAWEEAHIGLEYETGKLAFLMDATVSASVMWHGLKTYPFTFSVNNYYIKVSSTTDYDRSLCNCSQMMQGNRGAGVLPAPPGSDSFVEAAVEGAGEEAGGAREVESAAAVGTGGGGVFLPPVAAATAAEDGRMAVGAGTEAKDGRTALQ